MSTPFGDKPTLVGDLVTLRPIRAADAHTIDRLIREDNDITRLTGSIHRSTELPREMPIDDLGKIYGTWATAEDRLVLGVIDNASGDLVGEVVLNGWQEGNRSCNYRTLIGRPGRGRGLGTGATELIVAYGLGHLSLHRISLEVYDFNPRARHVYEKVGFVPEGTGRDALALRRRVDRCSLHGNPRKLAIHSSETRGQPSPFSQPERSRITGLRADASRKLRGPDEGGSAANPAPGRR